MNVSPQAALLGQTIAGKFHVECFIGGGAMGAVYKARQIALDKVVAIKVMHPERARDTMYATLFQREAARPFRGDRRDPPPRRAVARAGLRRVRAARRAGAPRV